MSCLSLVPFRPLPTMIVLAALVVGCGEGSPAPTQPAAHAPAADADADAPGDGTATATDDVGQPTPPFEPLTVDPPCTHDVTGRYGGTLTWAETTEVASFNPTVTSTATEAELSALVFDSLITYDNAEWKHRPSLAWKWESSDDGLVWTFHLRKGIRWSDGEPFTAADVVFTYAQVTFNENIESSDKDGFKVGDAPYPSVEALDDFTVRFTLPRVNALFLTYTGGIAIVPEHLWKDAVTGDKPTYSSAMVASDDLGTVVGTGAFRVIAYSGAEHVLYERNPYYWGVDRNGHRLPYVDRAQVLLYKDQSSRATAFLAGDYDLITDIPAPEYDRVKQAEGTGAFNVHRLGLSLNTNWISFNQYPGNGPDGKPYVEPYKLRLFQNPKFRRAMSHAIDRDNLVKLMLDGKGEAIYGPTSPSNEEWYSDDYVKTPYDQARAKELLAEIGLSDRDGDGVLDDSDGHRVTVELTTNVDNPVRIKVLNQIKADWVAVGVEAVVKTITFQELVHDLEDGHSWEVMMLGWGSAVPPDPLYGKNIHLSSGRLHVWYPQQPTPASDWEREGDAIIEKMSGLPNAADRKPLWAKYLRHHAEGLPILYLYAQNAYAASKPRVQNLQPSILRPQLWHNVEELWLAD